MTIERTLPMNGNGPSRMSLRVLAADLASLAGEELQRRHGRVEGSRKTAAGDLVSDADRAAEAVMIERLTQLRPDDGIVGEEMGHRPSRSGLTWVLDPLDGTMNYLRESGPWAVSVAVRDRSATLAGAVLVVPSGDVYTAALGAGASLNVRRLELGSAPEPAAALVATGFAYERELRVAWAERLPALLGTVADIRRSGTAATDICAAAAGRVDAYVEQGLHEWDVAAGLLIAREAGQHVETVARGEDRLDVLVCHPGLLPTLREALHILPPRGGGGPVTGRRGLPSPTEAL